MGRRAGLFLAAMLASAALAAHAQEKAQDPPPAAEKPAADKPAASAKPPPGRTVEGLTVTGASQNGFRSDIDRKSYGIASDLQTTTGSISDALRNIPSVEVDPQGNVSLRGDANVTILVDGKPSGQFKGPSAGQALQALPADTIERVEVLTNPSAEFSPEGTAGIINLITKKTRKAGASGSVRAVLGNDGRRQAGLTAAYNSGNLTVSADANGRWDPQPVAGLDVGNVLDGQGHLLAQSRNANGSDPNTIDFWGARLAVDYDVDKALRLSGEARFNHLDLDSIFRQNFQDEDASGVADLAYLADGRGTFGRGDEEFQATARRSFGADDHTLTVNLDRERLDEERDMGNSQTLALPAPADAFFATRTFNHLNRSEAKADYVRPMPGDGKLKAGLDLRSDENSYDTAGRRGVSEGAAGPDAGQTNLFLYRQTVSAAYATYEQPLGDWTVLAGLRLEAVDRHLDQVTAGDAQGHRDAGAYPTLHLADRLSDAQQLTFSYSRRIQRPGPEDLNSFRSESDPANFRAGNPDLKPQTTDSFEAGYQYRAGGSYYLATLYYRRNEHGVTDVVTVLPDGAFLSTKANLTDSQAVGLELVANGHLTKTLSYNASSNLYRNEIEATAQSLDQLIGFAGRRSDFEVGGRASLTWTPTPKDTLQFSANYNARRLTPQGYDTPLFLSYLGYRRKFSDNLFGFVTIQDPFDTLRLRQVIDTPGLQEDRTIHQHIRGLFFGLQRNFGSGVKKPREPGFDFGG